MYIGVSYMQTGLDNSKHYYYMYIFVVVQTYARQSQRCNSWKRCVTSRSYFSPNNVSARFSLATVMFSCVNTTPRVNCRLSVFALRISAKRWLFFPSFRCAFRSREPGNCIGTNRSILFSFCSMLRAKFSQYVSRQIFAVQWA